MFAFSKIEKITRDVTISHFLLMFGYKLFSLYFPLFLVAKGFSLPRVGYTYLLIYLPIAIFAPIVSFLNHKINPIFLTVLGILGYAVYASGMVLIQNYFLFYLLQVILGISAALFFVSTKIILMNSKLENLDRTFAYYYTAPFYADALAPIIGAFSIWKFNFTGVFILSLIIQISTAIFFLIKLRREYIYPLNKTFNWQNFRQNYQEFFPKIKEKKVLVFLIISLSVLFLSGFYQSFFFLFLEEKLYWSQNQILLFGSLFSLLFLPISILVIKLIEKLKSEKNIFWGSFITGSFSILFGLLATFLNFWLSILLMIGKTTGILMTGSGRSSFLNEKLKKYPEEAGAIDTIFSPLGVALGALVGGLIVPVIGYIPMFFIMGILVLTIKIFGKKLTKIKF